jgi:hypothetical protein
LRGQLTGHSVETVSFNKWTGYTNGDLLRMAEANAFDVLITGDQNLIYQQSMSARKIALAILSAQDFELLKHHLRDIQTAVNNAVPGSFQTVDCGTFRRPRTSSGNQPT